MSTPHTIRILVVEDSATDALLIDEALSDLPDFRPQLIRAERLSDGLARARESRFDVALLDLGLPDAQGVSTFRTFHRHAADVPVLVLTGLDDITVGLQAIQEGAQDYLLKKDIRASLLNRAIRYAIERHRIASALAASEERFQLAVSGATAGLWDWNPQTGAMYLSPHFKAIMGYKDHELPNEAWAHQDAIHPDDFDRVRAHLNAHLEHKGVYDEQYRVRTQSGDFRWVQSCGQALWNDVGVPYRMVGWIMDITDRRRTEDEIRELNNSLERRVAERTAELQAMNAELEAFSYSVSHDLRAPLLTIAGFSHALLEDCMGKLDDVGVGHVRQILKASQRMTELTNDLLRLARVVRQPLERKPVDLASIARDVVDSLQRQFPGRVVEFTVSDCPVASADPPLLKIVLENLLGNAWKFTAKKALARIEFGSTNRGEAGTTYYVRDNGAGFDMAGVTKLFGLFQRLHSVEEFEGTGLGLATVQRIVQRHGGQVWGEGVVGIGATFYFSLQPSAKRQIGDPS